MKKEDITLLLQILNTMKETVVELEKAQKKKKAEMISAAKKEILELQRKVDELIK